VEIGANVLDPPEPTEARTWYTRAAEAGNTDAQYNLGLLLITGIDPPEPAEGRAWLTQAAKAGHDGARDALEQHRDG
jgi:uncharacterized protein